MNDKVCPWELKDVIKVFLFYIVMLGVGCPLVLSLLEIIPPEKALMPSDDNILLFLTLLINTTVCLYIFYVASLRSSQPLSALGFSLKNLKRYLPLSILFYLLALPLILSAGQLVEYVVRALNGTPQSQELITHFMEERSPGVVTSMLFFAAIFGPFTEEVLFRGFLQPALREIVGVWKAIFLSAFLFAFVHLNLYVFLQVFLLGLVLAYLFEKTGTLLSPILVHMLHNTTTLTYLFWNKQQGNLLG